MSKNKKHEIVRTEHVSVSFSGPLPPPNVLKQYDEIKPGLLDTIVKMANEQSEHRRHLEKTVIEANAFTQKVSPFLATIVLVTCIGFSYLLVTVGQSIVGIALMFTAIASVVGITAWGKYSERKDLRAGADSFNKAAQEAISPDRQIKD